MEYMSKKALSVKKKTIFFAYYCLGKKENFSAVLNSHFLELVPSIK